MANIPASLIQSVDIKIGTARTQSHLSTSFLQNKITNVKLIPNTAALCGCPSRDINPPTSDVLKVVKISVTDFRRVTPCSLLDSTNV